MVLIRVAKRFGRGRDRGDAAAATRAHFCDQARAALVMVVVGVLHSVSRRLLILGERHYRRPSRSARGLRYHRRMTASPPLVANLGLREAKRSVRERILRARDALPAQLRTAASAAIAATLSGRPDFTPPGGARPTLP